MKPRLFKTHAGMLAFLTSRPAAVYSVLVLHDDQCSPSRCTCSPWYEVRDGTAETVTEGAKLQAKWIKETAS